MGRHTTVVVATQRGKELIFMALDRPSVKSESVRVIVFKGMLFEESDLAFYEVQKKTWFFHTNCETKKASVEFFQDDILREFKGVAAKTKN